MTELILSYLRSQSSHSHALTAARGKPNGFFLICGFPNLRSGTHRAFTLVELLVAISITLVMMATVVGVFATVSSSVSKRQAAIEAGNQVRHTRNVLQRDLEGITCPALPWTKPGSNAGYIEIVEGFHSDFFPSLLTDTDPANGEIDHTTSTIPSSNLVLPDATWVTDGGGLGDYDDILAFTSRNETEPFTGPVPARNFDPGNDNQQLPFAEWGTQSLNSQLAEVIWFCVENPDPRTSIDEAATRDYFGEAGFRTIYRRTLLIAPWLDYFYDARDGVGSKSRPGVLRILPPNTDQPRALAALVAFQERYDISARIEFDPSIDSGSGGRWAIKANTLSDLTKRENRYEHHGLDPTSGNRAFPYPMVFVSNNAPNGNPRFDPEFSTGIRPFIEPGKPQYSACGSQRTGQCRAVDHRLGTLGHDRTSTRSNPPRQRPDAQPGAGVRRSGVRSHGTGIRPRARWLGNSSGYIRRAQRRHYFGIPSRFGLAYRPGFQQSAGCGQRGLR